MERLIRYGLIVFFLSLAVIGSFFLPRRELRSIGQVAGMAVDEKDGRFYTTYELYSGSADQPIGESCELVYSSGETLQECLENAAYTYGKELDLNDSSALILQGGNEKRLIGEVISFYSRFENNQMELPVFFAKNQSASAIFNGKGKILSTQLADSARLLKKRQTVRNLMNHTGEKVWIQGEGSYEIVS